MIGSGLIIYALTGMVTENISLSGFRDWKKITELMSDSHYQNKDIVLSCFSGYGKNKKSPSNHFRNSEEVSRFLAFENSTITNQEWNEEEK